MTACRPVSFLWHVSTIVEADFAITDTRFMVLLRQNGRPKTAAFKTFLFVAVAVMLCSTTTSGQELPETPARSSDFSAGDVAAAQQFGQTLGVADWLGPMAPVALSPFFGIMCLSGMSLYGKGWVSADNAFLGEGSPLHNPAVFWTFLILTLITSIPRLTKVSKPFAQAVDQVEAWAGIITLLALKMMMGQAAPDSGDLPVAQLAMVQAGVLSASANTLLMIAAAINVFVINAVKFFFEFLIWITPVPTIDAIFEVANKTICAALMAIYGYSPTIATAINLAIFVAAAFVFGWVYRREVFYRTALMDAAWALVSPPKEVAEPELTVFPAAEFGEIPPRARCKLRRTDNGWTLTQQRLLGSNVMVALVDDECAAELDAGYLTNSLIISGNQSGTLTFSRWYNGLLPELATAMGATLNAQDAAVIRDRSGLQTEMG